MMTQRGHLGDGELWDYSILTRDEVQRHHVITHAKRAHK